MMISTDHPGLTLRRLGPEDLPDLVQRANNVNIARNLRDVFPHPYTMTDARNYLERQPTEGHPTNLVIALDDRLVGLLGLFIQEDVYRFNYELGYWVSEDLWGQGIATSAIGAACRWLFQDTEAHRIFAHVFAFNPASARALEKAGFRPEGIGREAVFKEGRFWDEIRYGLLRSDVEADPV